MDLKLVSTQKVRLKDDHRRINTKSRLSVTDVFNGKFSVHFLLIYKPTKGSLKLDTAKLIKSLESTLEYYPEFTGSLEKTKKEMNLKFDNNGVEFSIYESCMKTEDAMDIVNNKKFLQGSLDGALLKIKMTILSDSGYVLCFNFHHSICDGWGFVWFLKAWSNIFQQDNDSEFHEHGPGSFGSYRSSAIEDRCLITGYENKKEIEAFREFTLNKSIAPTDIFLVGDVNIQFLVSKASLSPFKVEYRKQRVTSDPEYISTTDIISAIVWKASVRAKQVDEKEQTVFGAAHNFRKKFDLDESFFGNAVLPFSVKLYVKEVLTLDIRDIAVLVRKEIVKFDKSQIKSKLGFMESANDWNLTRSNIHSARNDFFMASWETFPLFNIEFNNGRPEGLFFDSIGIGSTIVFPTENKDILSLHFSFKKDEWTRFSEDEHIKRYFRLT